MKKSTTILIVSCILILLVGFLGWKLFGEKSAGEARKQVPPMVSIDNPRRENVLYEIKFTGDILPDQQATIYSKVPGTLEKIFVDMGESVHEGELLALIDTTELSQQLQLAEATYQNSQLNYDRNKDLSEQNLVAKQDLDNANAALKIAKANYDVAKTKLSYARITAPFNGVVTKRFLDPGAAITANNVMLFTLMDIGEMKVIVNVLEKDIPRVLIGSEAIITVDAFPDEKFIGRIKRLSQAVELTTRTMAMEVDIPNEHLRLKPGMFANVTLLVDEHKDAFTIPTSALLKDEKSYFVYISRNSIAQRKNITIGVEQNGRTEILSGITDDDNIIVAGQTFVRDSAQVTIQK